MIIIFEFNVILVNCKKSCGLCSGGGGGGNNNCAGNLYEYTPKFRQKYISNRNE